MKKMYVKHTLTRSTAFMTFTALLLVASFLFSPPASAYQLNGTKWGGSTQRISIVNIRDSKNYKYALVKAVQNISSTTDVTFSYTVDSSPSWKATVLNYGNTDWEAQSTWSYTNGIVHSAESKINLKILPPDTSVARLEVVWLHELCHVWGLDHVTSMQRVMYKSASDAYLQGGVREQTSDEIDGINALY